MSCYLKSGREINFQGCLLLFFLHEALATFQKSSTGLSEITIEALEIGDEG